MIPEETIRHVSPELFHIGYHIRQKQYAYTPDRGLSCKEIPSFQLFLKKEEYTYYELVGKNNLLPRLLPNQLCSSTPFTIYLGALKEEIWANKIEYHKKQPFMLIKKYPLGFLFKKDNLISPHFWRTSKNSKCPAVYARIEPFVLSKVQVIGPPLVTPTCHNLRTNRRGKN